MQRNAGQGKQDHGERDRTTGAQGERDPQSPEARQVDLEVKTAFLEQTLEALNEVVIEQGQSIEQLTRRLSELESLAKGQGNDGEGPRTLQDDRPPHY